MAQALQSLTIWQLACTYILMLTATCVTRAYIIEVCCHFCCLPRCFVQESTVPGDICNSNFPHDVVSYSEPLSNACDFPLTLGSSPNSFYSSFPSPLAISPNSPFATHVGSHDSPFATHVSSHDSPFATHMSRPCRPYTRDTGSSALYSSPHLGSPDPFLGLHSPTPPLGPQSTSLRPMTPNDNLDQPFLLQRQSQTESLGQTDSSSFCTQAAATAYQPGFARNYGDHSFAAQQGPYSLPDAASDMYTFQMNPKLGNGSEELLHRPETSNSPMLKYTDWHKQAAPGLSASAVRDDSWRRRLHNMDTSASPALAAPASRPGALLPKALFNMSGPGGNDCEQEARAFSTFLAHMPKNDDLLGRSLSSSMGGGYYEADKQAGMGIKGLEEADRRSSLLIQAGQPMPGGLIDVKCLHHLFCNRPDTIQQQHNARGRLA